MSSSPIVNRINALLAERGIQKGAFYRDCGITSASYSLWNTGKTSPRQKTLDVIAAYLDTTTGYLLTGLGPRDNIPGRVSFDDFTYAMQNETRELTDMDRQILLSMAHQLNEARKKKDGEIG